MWIVRKSTRRKDEERSAIAFASCVSAPDYPGGATPLWSGAAGLSHLVVFHLIEDQGGGSSSLRPITQHCVILSGSV